MEWVWYLRHCLFSLSTQIICVPMKDHEELGVLLSIHMPLGKSPGEEWSPPTGSRHWLLLTSCEPWPSVSVPHSPHLQNELQWGPQGTSGVCPHKALRTVPGTGLGVQFRLAAMTMTMMSIIWLYLYPYLTNFCGGIKGSGDMGFTALSFYFCICLKFIMIESWREREKDLTAERGSYRRE